MRPPLVDHENHDSYCLQNRTFLDVRFDSFIKIVMPCFTVHSHRAKLRHAGQAKIGKIQTILKLMKLGEI